MNAVPEESRAAAFEAMLRSIQAQYRDTAQKMAELKATGREKSATYRQLMGNRLQLKEMLSRYQAYGLIDEIDP